MTTEVSSISTTLYSSSIEEGETLSHQPDPMQSSVSSIQSLKPAESMTIWESIKCFFATTFYSTPQEPNISIQKNGMLITIDGEAWKCDRIEEDDFEEMTRCYTCNHGLSSEQEEDDDSSVSFLTLSRFYNTDSAPIDECIDYLNGFKSRHSSSEFSYKIYHESPSSIKCELSYQNGSSPLRCEIAYFIKQDQDLLKLTYTTDEQPAPKRDKMDKIFNGVKEVLYKEDSAASLNLDQRIWKRGFIDYANSNVNMVYIPKDSWDNLTAKEKVEMFNVRYYLSDDDSDVENPVYDTFQYIMDDLRMKTLDNFTWNVHNKTEDSVSCKVCFYSSLDSVSPEGERITTYEDTYSSYCLFKCTKKDEGVVTLLYSSPNMENEETNTTKWTEILNTFDVDQVLPQKP